MITILNDTFKADGTNEYGYTVGSVDIDLGFGKVVNTRAVASQRAGLQVAGFVGRYVTSPKPWAATVDGTGSKLFVHFGRDDRSGRFNKANALRFEPDTYAGLTNPKFWAAA